MSDLLLTGDIEPWRCEHCDKLIYNVDEHGYPAPGAPPSLHLDSFWKNVCMLCFQLGSIVRDKTYWKALHDKWKAPREENRWPQ